MNGSSTKIQAQTPWLPKMEETRFKVVHVPVCFCGLFFKCAMNADFEMTLLMVSSPLIWAKLTFVALTNHESFRDTTGYVTVYASRQRSTILVLPSRLILPSFHPISFSAFNSSKAILRMHYTYIQIPPTYIVQSDDILHPTIIGKNQLPTPL